MTADIVDASASFHSAFCAMSYRNGTARGERLRDKLLNSSADRIESTDSRVGRRDTVGLRTKIGANNYMGQLGPRTIHDLLHVGQSVGKTSQIRVLPTAAAFPLEFSSGPKRKA